MSARSLRHLLIAALGVPLLAGSVRGQDDRAVRQQPTVRRQQLEQQLGFQFWKVAKNRIGLTDAQMLPLERASQRYDLRRRELAKQERVQRIALRAEILADSLANQNAIAAALDKLRDLQRERLDVQAEEQKELATFMTPLQRAKFLALQEQIRKRLQELVRTRPDSSKPTP